MQIQPQEAIVNPGNVHGSYLTVSYPGMKNGDVGLPASNDTATAQGVSVQVTGTFGGASVAIEGTNDGENWSPLRDPSSTLIAIRSPAIRSVLEGTAQVIPVVTGGDETTNLTVTMMFRRA